MKKAIPDDEIVRKKNLKQSLEPRIQRSIQKKIHSMTSLGLADLNIYIFLNIEFINNYSFTNKIRIKSTN